MSRVLTLLLLACDDPDTDADSVALGPLVAIADPTIPTIFDVTWSDTLDDVQRYVEYGREGEAMTRRTPALPGPSARVIGLSGGRSWDLRAVAEAADGSRVESEMLTVDVEAPPSGLPRFVLQGDPRDLGAATQSLVFVSVIQDGNAWIAGLDELGEYAWWHESEGHRDIDAIHLSTDGGGIDFTHFGITGSDTGIGHIRVDGSGVSYTSAPEGHHDAIAASDGTQYYISSQIIEDAVLESGESTDVSTDTIRRITPSASEPEQLFGFPQNYPHPLYRTCGHFDQEKAGGGHDYSHTNSVMVDEEAGQLLFMSKNLDSLTAIDLESGTFLWQIGGRWSDYTDVAGDDPPDADTAWQVDGPNETWWSHGHMSDYWGDGMLVFDNGYHHFDMVSRVVEYRIDHDLRTIEKVQSWESPAGAFSPVLGDARRLPSGNRLLAYMLEGRVVEATPEGDLIWDAVLELGAGVGRIAYVPDVYAGQNTLAAD